MAGVCLPHLGQCLDGLPILVGDNGHTCGTGMINLTPGMVLALASSIAATVDP